MTMQELINNKKSEKAAADLRTRRIAEGAKAIETKYCSWVAEIKELFELNVPSHDITIAAIETIETWIKEDCGLEGLDALEAYRQAMRYNINGAFDEANICCDWYASHRILCDIFEQATLWHALDWEEAEEATISLTHHSGFHYGGEF